MVAVAQELVREHVKQAQERLGRRHHSTVHGKGTRHGAYRAKGAPQGHNRGLYGEALQERHAAAKTVVYSNGGVERLRI